MKFALEIICDNRAFQDRGLEPEVAQILRETAERIDVWFERQGLCVDSNNNVVGFFEFTEIPPS